MKMWILRVYHEDIPLDMFVLFTSREAALEHHRKTYPDTTEEDWEKTFPDCWNFDAGFGYMHVLYEQEVVA